MLSIGHRMNIIHFRMIHWHLKYRWITWRYDCNHLVKVQRRSLCSITRNKYSTAKESFSHIKPSQYATPECCPILLGIRAKRQANILFTSDITAQGSIHDHNSRHMDNIWTARVRLNIADTCIRNYLPRRINSFPNNSLPHMNTHSIHGFVIAVKQYILNQYQENATEQSGRSPKVVAHFFCYAL